MVSHAGTGTTAPSLAQPAHPHSTPAPVQAQPAQPAQPAAAASSSSTSVAGNSWTEPPWSGWIETTGDALIILEAARRGLIPRVTRRLVDAERKMITSGSVFVFDEDESGIKRWTDGYFWSPSRILGNFLLYRETDKRGAGHRGKSEKGDPHGEGAGGGSSLLVNENGQPESKDQQSLSRPKGELNTLGLDKHRERSLVGSLTNSYKFKPDGMMKKTFSLTIAGVSQHLISYYKIEDVEQGRLRTPSSLPELASLDISAEYLDKTHFRNPPKVDYDRDGVPRYRGEADEAEPSPRQTIAVPMPNGQPLLAESREGAEGEYGGKRSKRYDPYGNTSAGTKRPRKKASGSGSGAGQGTTSGESHSGASQSPTTTTLPSASGQQASHYTGSEAYPHYGNVSYYQSGGMYAMPTHAHATHLYTPSAQAQAQAQGYSSAALPLGTASPTTESPTSANSHPATSSPPPAQTQGQSAYGYASAEGGQSQSQTQSPSLGQGQGQSQSQSQSQGQGQGQGQSAQNYTYYPTQSSHYTPYSGMGWPTTYGYPAGAAGSSNGIGGGNVIGGSAIGGSGIGGIGIGGGGGVGKVEEEESNVGVSVGVGVGMRTGGHGHGHGQAVAAEARDA